MCGGAQRPPRTARLKRSLSALESLSPFSSRASSSSSSSTAPTSLQSPVTVKVEALPSPFGSPCNLDSTRDVEPPAKRARVKPERFSPTSTGASHPTSSPGKPCNTPTKKGKRKEKDDLPEGVYVVAHILARSLAKGYADGKHEYQYLVRWQGYGPDDDTWEFRSTLLEGSSQILKRFDRSEQPFKILESRGIGLKKTYRVRYCLESPTILASPQAPEDWHTVKQIVKYSKLSDEIVRDRIAEFDYATLGYRTRLPVVSDGTTPQKQFGKARHKMPSDGKAPPKQIGHTRPQPEAYLIAFVDKAYKYGKEPSAGDYNPIYLAEYRIGATVMKEWMDYKRTTKLFGRKGAQVGRDAYRRKSGARTLDSPHSGNGVQVGDSDAPELVSILDIKRLPGKSAPTKYRSYNYGYLAEYKVGSRVIEEWMGSSRMVHLFGSENFRKGREAFRAARDAAKATWQPADSNEYEDERRRNIEENQELMKQLGFFTTAPHGSA